MVWIPDSRHFQPVLGRKFHVESEFEVENTQCLDPEGKNKEKRNSKKIFFIRFFDFLFFKSVHGVILPTILRPAGRQTGQTGGTDRKTDRTDRQTDRQADRHSEP